MKTIMIVGDELIIDLKSMADEFLRISEGVKSIESARTTTPLFHVDGGVAVSMHGKGIRIALDAQRDPYTRDRLRITCEVSRGVNDTEIGSRTIINLIPEETATTPYTELYREIVHDLADDLLFVIEDTVAGIKDGSLHEFIETTEDFYYLPKGNYEEVKLR